MALSLNVVDKVIVHELAHVASAAKQLAATGRNIFAEEAAAIPLTPAFWRLFFSEELFAVRVAKVKLHD